MAKQSRQARRAQIMKEIQAAAKSNHPAPVRKQMQAAAMALVAAYNKEFPQARISQRDVDDAVARVSKPQGYAEGGAVTDPCRTDPDGRECQVLEARAALAAERAAQQHLQQLPAQQQSQPGIGERGATEARSWRERLRQRFGYAEGGMVTDLSDGAAGDGAQIEQAIDTILRKLLHVSRKSPATAQGFINDVRSDLEAFADNTLGLDGEQNGLAIYLEALGSFLADTASLQDYPHLEQHFARMTANPDMRALLDSITDDDVGGDEGVVEATVMAVRPAANALPEVPLHSKAPVPTFKFKPMSEEQLKADQAAMEIGRRKWARMGEQQLPDRREAQRQIAADIVRRKNAGRGR